MTGAIRSMNKNMIYTLKAWIARYPVKLGLALQTSGHYLMGIGAVASISGTHTTLVEFCVIIGFFIGGAGQFIATLFTNGRSVEFPLSTSVQAHTTVDTVLQAAPAKPLDGAGKTAQTSTP